MNGRARGNVMSGGGSESAAPGVDMQVVTKQSTRHQEGMNHSPAPRHEVLINNRRGNGYAWEAMPRGFTCELQTDKPAHCNQDLPLKVQKHEHARKWNLCRVGKPISELPTSARLHARALSCFPIWLPAPGMVVYRVGDGLYPTPISCLIKVIIDF